MSPTFLYLSWTDWNGTRGTILVLRACCSLIDCVHTKLLGLCSDILREQSAVPPSSLWAKPMSGVINPNRLLKTPLPA